MNTINPLRRAPLWAGSLLALSTLAAQAGNGPLDNKCNENPPALDAWDAVSSHLSGDLAWRVELTGTPLQPGQTVPTLGTNRVESPELVGKTVIAVANTPFSFSTPSGPVAGFYSESIQASKTGGGTCKQNVQLKLTSGCVSKVRFKQYNHPLGLDIVADFRDDPDLKGKVFSNRASRSPVDGLIFEFHLKRPVCAGQSTRWLLLNTSIRDLTTADALELVAPDGTVSPQPFLVHVPLPLP